MFVNRLNSPDYRYSPPSGWGGWGYFLVEALREIPKDGV